MFAGTSANFILTQNADGTFTERAKVLGYFIGGESGRFADLTDDGRLDLVFGSALHVQRPDGTFADPVPSVVPGGILALVRSPPRRQAAEEIDRRDIRRCNDPSVPDVLLFSFAMLVIDALISPTTCAPTPRHGCPGLFHS